MERPRGLTALSVLAIIVGSIGAVVSLLGLFGLAGSAAFLVASQGAGQAAMQGLRESLGGWLMAWMVADNILDLIATAVLAAAGFGMLQLREGARKTAVWTSAAFIGLASFELFVAIATGFAVQRQGLADGAPSMSREAFLALFATAASCGFLLTIALPVVLLYYVTRPRIKAVFAAAEAEEAETG
jgi:hypothetical protein